MHKVKRKTETSTVEGIMVADVHFRHLVGAKSALYSVEVHCNEVTAAGPGRARMARVVVHPDFKGEAMPRPVKTALNKVIKWAVAKWAEQHGHDLA